jgi:hypothetical protein
VSNGAAEAPKGVLSRVYEATDQPTCLCAYATCAQRMVAEHQNCLFLSLHRSLYYPKTKSCNKR